MGLMVKTARLVLALMLADTRRATLGVPRDVIEGHESMATGRGIRAGHLHVAAAISMIADTARCCRPGRHRSRPALALRYESRFFGWLRQPIPPRQRDSTHYCLRADDVVPGCQLHYHFGFLFLLIII